MGSLSASVIAAKDLPSAGIAAWLDRHSLPKDLCDGLVKQADNLRELLGLEPEDIESISKELGLNVAKRRKLIRACVKQNENHGKDRIIASLKAKIQNLRMQPKAFVTGGGGVAKPVWVKTGPGEGDGYMLQDPTRLTNLDYLRRILDETGKALLQHYRTWVANGNPAVVVSDRPRSPDEADAYAVLKHVQDNHDYYAKQMKWHKGNELLDRVKALMKLRNHFLGHQSLANPRKCTRFQVAEAMVSAVKIAPWAADWVYDNLRNLKKQYETQIGVKDLFTLTS